MIDEKFKKAVQELDISKVRDMLCSRLTLDHDVTGGMFHEYFEYAKSISGENHLFEPHDGRALPKENTKENFKLLLGQLSTNFSSERLGRVLEIAKSVWNDEQTSQKSNLRQENFSSNQTAENAGENGRVVGEERILDERPLYAEDEETDLHSLRRTTSNGSKTQQSDKNSVAVVACVAIVAAVIVAGVVIFG